MQEILTPVQFEPALDVLNKINKLNISHRASLSLEAMQACKNPVGHGNPVIGKFCKEDKHGALSIHYPDKGFKSYEYTYYLIGTTVECAVHTFAQKVGGILIKTQAQRPLDYSVQWKTPSGGVIKTFDNLVWDWLPFEGETISICVSVLGAVFKVWLYGFY